MLYTALMENENGQRYLLDIEAKNDDDAIWQALDQRGQKLVRLVDGKHDSEESVLAAGLYDYTVMFERDGKRELVVVKAGSSVDAQREAGIKNGDVFLGVMPGVYHDGDKFLAELDEAASAYYEQQYYEQQRCFD